jgi:ParB-like chromosome segregation protein Spo0J
VAAFSLGLSPFSFADKGETSHKGDGVMQRRTADLKPHPMNRKLYGEEVLPPEFVASIQENGILVPLAVKEDGTIISGHRRWQAALALKMEHVPVQVVRYTDDLDEREAIIEFNRQREKTFSQKMAEAEELEAIERERARRRQLSQLKRGHQEPVKETLPEREKGQTRDKVAAAVGLGSGRTYDKAAKVWEAAKKGDETAKKVIAELDEGKTTINAAYKAVVKEAERKEKEQAREQAEKHLAAPLKRSAQVSPGEWWQLGRHILFCGDTSTEEFVSRMPKVPFAFADPPYNAGVAEWDEGFEWRHDWLIEKAQVVAVTPGISSIFDFARITKMPYKWSVACWIDNGMTRGALGFGNWIYAAIFSDSSLHRNAQDFVRVSIKANESDNTVHKGRKPSEFIAWLIGLFTKRGDSVIDPFLGSGTTLLVAETMGRICYGGEINPEFCAEIIARWETMTGLRAEVIARGAHALRTG